jgi:hypothetical protein
MRACAAERRLQGLRRGLAGVCVRVVPRYAGRDGGRCDVWTGCSRSLEAANATVRQHKGYTDGQRLNALGRVVQRRAQGRERARSRCAVDGELSQRS